MNQLDVKLAEIEVSYKPLRVNHPIIRCSKDAYTCLVKSFPEETISLQERFVVAYLNRANRIMGVYELSQGGITGTVADPRLILGVALKSAAVGIILAHNHPSGNKQPSVQDKEITRKINDACKLLDISLIDHLIIVPDAGDYYSFMDEGLL